MSQGSEQEVLLGKDEFIITKTDTQGRIQYGNRVFMRLSNYTESDFLHQNHNLIRHPDMPKGVFYGLWHTLKAGNEFFGFVKNRTSDGNYYWVFANITPDYENDKLIGYYSVRRTAPEGAKQTISAIYQEMREIEQRASKGSAPETSWNQMIDNIAQQHGLSYSEFIINLYNSHLD